MINFNICPVCASAKVDQVKLVGLDVEVACSNCGWQGRGKDLIEAGVREQQVMRKALSTGDRTLFTDIAAEVSAVYLTLLAKYAGRPIGLALMEAGLVGGKDKKSMARLLRAACSGAHKATLDEIEKMQEEVQDARRLALS